MKKENQPGNYQLKADLEGNYLIDKKVPIIDFYSHNNLK